MSRYYILKNRVMEPADLLTWAQWFEVGSNRRIAETEVDGVRVSTVVLGFDHGFGGRPLYFETMVFGGTQNGYQERYATLDEAEAGHERIVTQLRNGQTLE